MDVNLCNFHFHSFGFMQGTIRSTPAFKFIIMSIFILDISSLFQLNLTNSTHANEKRKYDLWKEHVYDKGNGE